MQITKENLPKSEVKLTITLSQEDTDKFMKKAAEQVSQMVKVPGFRPGKAPLDVLKKHVKDGAIEGQMVDLAIPETYSEAVKKEKVQVISKAQIKIVEEAPLKYEATVAIYPEIKIEGYDKIKVKPQEVKVEDKDVEDILMDLRKRHATYSKADRSAKMGDKIEVDFEGFDDGGAVLEGTQSKNHPVMLGEGMLVPGFEDELIGLKKDDEKSFKIKFPKDYFHKAFKGKKVEFRVKVHGVEEMKLPDITAEFLKKALGEDKPLAEVKETIKKNIQQEKEHAEKVRQEDEFLNGIAEKVKVDVPNALIEEEIDGMMEEFQNQLSQKGITIQKYLEQSKKEMKDLREQRTKEAEKRLKLRFALQHIFEQENITASEEELKKEVEHIISLYPENERKKVEEEYKKGSYLKRRLENKIKMDKLFATYLTKS